MISRNCSCMCRKAHTRQSLMHKDGVFCKHCKIITDSGWHTCFCSHTGPHSSCFSNTTVKGVSSNTAEVPAARIFDQRLPLPPGQCLAEPWGDLAPHISIIEVFCFNIHSSIAYATSIRQSVKYDDSTNHLVLLIRKREGEKEKEKKEGNRERVMNRTREREETKKQRKRNKPAS